MEGMEGRDSFGVFPARILIREGVIDDGKGERFEFPAEISNDKLDTYSTHMTDGSLRNFARDAKVGVAFLEGHNTQGLGYGRTFRGKFEEIDNKNRVVADVFVLRRMNFQNLTFATSDDFIRAVDGGHVGDVSVGFYDANFICDICNREVWDFWAWMNDEEVCEHMPGVEYKNDDGKRVICTAEIQNARLAEVSAVYSGATPEAKIIRKCQTLYEHGIINEKSVWGMNQRFNLRMAPQEWESKLSKRSLFDMGALGMIKEAAIDGCPVDTEDKAVRWILDNRVELETAKTESETKLTESQESVTGVTEERDKLQGESELNKDLAIQSKKVREENDRLRKENETVITERDKLTELRETGVGLTERLSEVETERDGLKESVEQKDTRIVELETEVKEKGAMAEIGTEAREELIESTLESGVRAMGEDFDKEEEKEFLEGHDLETIRKWRTKYERMASKRFPNGRHTVDPKEQADVAVSNVGNVRSLRSYGITADKRQ